MRRKGPWAARWQRKSYFMEGAAMVRVRHAVLAAMMAAVATPAAAQVLDATYRGTMICDKLPFTSDKMREAIEVTISGGTVRYSHVVRLTKVAVEATAEQGTGALDGQKLSLDGSWKGGNRKYEAKYSGSFVRRSARLRGTQTWTDGGKTITRACAGAIKRPLRPFLPRQKQADAGMVRDRRAAEWSPAVARISRLAQVHWLEPNIDHLVA